MSTELVPKDGVVTHWTLHTFGVTACGLLSTVDGVTTVDKVSHLSCKECLRYVAKLDGRIYSCEICDRFWLGYEEAELHMYSHD